MTISGLRPPINGDSVSMRRWGLELVNLLGRHEEEASEDTTNSIAALQAQFEQDAQDALQAIIDDLTSITDFGDLSDAEKTLLGLSNEVADQLALDSDVLADIQPYIDSPGKAAVYAYLRAHQNAASVRVEESIRQTETLSLSNRITSLTADLESTDAAVISEQTARADGDSALASDITTVGTTVAGHTTSITEHQASIDGIQAEWGITIDSNGQVAGLIRLDADASESTFTVVVDKFQVGKIDGTGVVPIFQIGTVGGASRVALAGDMLVDGAIVAQHITAGTINLDHMAANSINASKLQTNSVSSAKIRSNAITANKVSAGAITADKINVSDLSAIAADFGTVTAGRIESADGNSFWDLDTNIFQIGTI